jgi:homoserine kinase type II
MQMVKRHQEVREVLGHYDLGEPVSLEQLSDSYANVNYILRTGRGVYLYRVCMQNPRERIADEMRIMALLRPAGFPTAYPLGRRDGGYISDGMEHPVVIYQFVEGHEPQLNENTAREIGEAVARLNSIKCPAGLDIRNFIRIDACHEFIERNARAKTLDARVWRYFTEETARLEVPLREPVPRGLVHGDVFPENTLFTGDRLRAIIDFEEACTDCLLFDVGMTIHGFCYKQERMQPELLESFLRAYEAVRPLSAKERELLPYYARWSAHGMIYWHLTQLVRRPQEKQWARVRALMRRVQALRSEGAAAFAPYIRQADRRGATGKRPCN